MRFVVMYNHILTQKVKRSKQLLGMIVHRLIAEQACLVHQVHLSLPSGLRISGYKLKSLGSFPDLKSVHGLGNFVDDQVIVIVLVLILPELELRAEGVLSFVG